MNFFCRKNSAHVTFMFQLKIWRSNPSKDSNLEKHYSEMEPTRSSTPVSSVHSDTYDSFMNYTTKQPVRAIITSLHLACFSGQLQKQASLNVLIKTVSIVLPKHMFKCGNVGFLTWQFCYQWAWQRYSICSGTNDPVLELNNTSITVQVEGIFYDFWKAFSRMKLEVWYA